MATKRYAVVLSDVHIGNGAPTCWYQAAVHEPQVTAVLRWILGNRDSVREVVLLGDLFDLWTYPPGVRPPSMREIIAANPGLLGPRGPLAAVVRALPGEVRLLLGNHDGSLTRSDIDELNRSLGGDPRRGERIELVGAPTRIVTGASGARTVFAHGHYFCMFNAPDSRSRWGTIPIGHFVSRAIAYRLSRTLLPGQTAADRGGSGNPSGVDWAGVVAAWNRRDDLAAFLLEYISRVTGMSQLAPIVMPDGSTTTARDAARIFAGLFTLWLRREGRWEDALRAANADRGGGEDLAYFAQRLALQTASDLAVMGHTHSAVAGLDVSPVDYINSGYECVARPDAARTPFTFTRVDLERATAELLAIVRTPIGFGVLPAHVPRLGSVIVRGRDYSCYARVENRTNVPLRLVRASKDSASYWVVPPPAVISPGARLGIWVQDTIGPSGSAARFSYSDGTRTYDFAVSCPTVLSNSVSSSVPYETKVGRGPWRSGRVDASGYPVHARFYVGAARPARWLSLPPAPARTAARARAGRVDGPVLATTGGMSQSRAHAHRGFSATDRTSELAAELLDVVNSPELEAFLGRLVAESAGPVGTRSGGELLGVLRETAERTLPALTTALGSAPAASVSARRASRVFGVELEGVSAEDRDYEIARQFVRFAQAAAAGSAAAPVGRAVAEAGRDFAPGLVGPHPL